MKNIVSDGEFPMPEPSVASQADSMVMPANAERRRAVRFRCKRRNAWRLFAAATSSAGDGIVSDISLTGISLLVDVPLRPGMFLELSLVQDSEPTSTQPILVRVRRATLQDDEKWLIGCTFVKRLTQSELRAWL
jgi:hypothetical protein